MSAQSEIDILVEQIFNNVSEIDRQHLKLIDLNDLLESVINKFKAFKCFHHTRFQIDEDEYSDMGPKPSVTAEEKTITNNIGWFSFLFLDTSRCRYMALQLINWLLGNSVMMSLVHDGTTPWGMIYNRIRRQNNIRGTIIARVSLCTFGSVEKLQKYVNQHGMNYWESNQ